MTGNLVDVIGRDTQLNRVASTNGGEYAGPCPFCGGRDRFRVWPNQDSGRWWCRQCERSGDAVAYLVEAGRIDRAGAYRLRHGDAGNVSGSPSKKPAGAQPAPNPAMPPNQVWQEHAWDLVAWAQAQLWGDAGGRVLGWLRGRRLTDNTIRQGGLGYVPADSWEDRQSWGLGPVVNLETGRPKRVWIPRGVVMPWVIGDDLWRVSIRRPVKRGGRPKCYSMPGFGNGLYDADQLGGTKPAMLVEGELDVLTVKQEAGDLVTPVATGGTGGARRARWVARLALCPVVLVAFDADAAGERARRWWLDALDNGKYWRPYWEDANGLLQDDAGVRAWVAAGLGDRG